MEIQNQTETQSSDYLKWHMKEIAYQNIDIERVTHNEALMFLLIASSFIERATDKYTGQLLIHFKDHPEIYQWLTDVWEGDEVQHGKSLAKYVTTVWPDFDWDTAYQHFMQEYEATCSCEYYEKERGLEMLSRCVVEMGTSSAYFAINKYSNEPILCDLADKIRRDEVKHYKIFLHYFKEYRAKKPFSKWALFRATYRRLKLMKNDDGYMALKYAFKAKYPNESVQSEHFSKILKETTNIVQDNLQLSTSIKMTLTPIGLSKRIQKWIEKPLIFYAKKYEVKSKH